MNKKRIKTLFIVLGAVLFAVLSVGVFQEVTQRDKFSYVRLTQVRLREKVFVNGNTKVRLQGMIHVAEASFYEEVTKNLPSRHSSKGQVVTLMEGVSEKVQPAIPKESYLNYKELASVTGLRPQVFYNARFPNVINADISQSEFSPEFQKHISQIEILLEIVIKLAKKEMTESEAEKKVKQNKKEWIAFVNYLRNSDNGRKNEIIDRRNDVLWTAILSHSETTRELIIPWGAAHLPDIENRLLDNGYTIVESTSFKGVDMGSVILNSFDFVAAYLKVAIFISEEIGN